MGEGGDVSLRVLLELRLIVAAAHLPLELVRPSDLAGVQLVDVSVHGDLLKHVRGHILVGQLLEDLLGTLNTNMLPVYNLYIRHKITSYLRHIARASEDKGHGTNGLGHHAKRYLVACVSDSLSGLVRVPVGQKYFRGSRSKNIFYNNYL